MSLTQAAADSRIEELGMDDLPLEKFRPIPHQIAPDWFKKYHELIHTFATTLTDSIQELAFLNLPQQDFIDLVMGRRLPENLSVRFRVPLVWGGKLELDNLFMCLTFPHAHNMDRFIIEQSGNDFVWLPNPAKKIYIPAHMAGGGDGGNATQDRLTEIAAQIVTSRGME
ncbi:MAG: hypothetical protein J5679_01380 [Alphaproteobacteria bacterium]|nr:hypothetical protein [Alphaproteobacteria bacterium]